MHEQKACGLQWIVPIGVINKTQYLQRSWALPNDSKHNEGSFSTFQQICCAYHRVGIIESVDSISRDGTDTPYM